MSKSTIYTAGNYESRQQEKLNKTSSYKESGTVARTSTIKSDITNATTSREVKSQVIYQPRKERTTSFTRSVEERDDNRNNLSRSDSVSNVEQKKINITNGNSKRVSNNVMIKNAGQHGIQTSADRTNSAYNPTRNHEETQQTKHGYVNQVRNNSSVRVGNSINKGFTANPALKRYVLNRDDSKKTITNKQEIPPVKEKTSTISSAYYRKDRASNINSEKDSKKDIKKPPKVRLRNNLYLSETAIKTLQKQVGQNDELGMQAVFTGVTIGFCLKTYYQTMNKGTALSLKAGKKAVIAGYKVSTGVYKSTKKTVDQFHKYGFKGTIKHRVDNSYVARINRLMKTSNSYGIEVLKSGGKFFVKGVGARTVKIGKSSLKTTVKSGSYIVKTATSQGLSVLESAMDSSGDIGGMAVSAGIKTGRVGGMGVKVGAKATSFTYRGVKTGVSTGIKTAKTSKKAVKYLYKNGWKKTGKKVATETAKGVKNIFIEMVKLMKGIILSAGKGLLAGLLAVLAIGGALLLTAPTIFTMLFFGGTGENKDGTEWNIHEYVLERAGDVREIYADDVLAKYQQIKNDGKYEIITLYNNLDGTEVEIKRNTIKTSIPTAEDFTEVIEPVFNVLMITRYQFSPTEKEKKDTFNYLWGMLKNMYTHKLSTVYCADAPADDGIYYAEDDCLRPSDTKYHSSDSGRDCCETTYTCKGHANYCSALSNCTNKLNGICQGHSVYCTDVSKCTNREEKFECSGYKECQGHRRIQIVMDFNGINALIGEEWGDRINELESKDNLSKNEKDELKELKSDKEFCLGFVDFLSEKDENYNTDYEITGTGGIIDIGDIDLSDYDLEGDDSIGANIAKTGLSRIGCNYAWGGTTWCNDISKAGIVGIDCSGFTQTIIREITGNTIPRTSSEQAKSGIQINSLADAKAGDLIFYGTDGKTGVGHVAIYLGNGQIVHASNSAPYPKGGVKVSSATYKTILAIRRYW